MMKPRIQLTLNSMKLEDAIRTAELASRDIDWLEVGNTLLKGEGLSAVKRLKERFPEKRILVDMRVVDSGREIEAASKSGADVVILTDNGNDKILAELVEVARLNGIEIMTELADVGSVKDRYKSLEDVGVNYLFINLSTAGEIREVKSISERIRLPIAVSVGADTETASEAVDFGAEIIIVGRGMGDMGNVNMATKEVKGLINSAYRKEAPVAGIDLDEVSADLDRIKDILIRLQEDKFSQEKRREEIENELEMIKGENVKDKKKIGKERKKLDDEIKDLERQRGRIMEEWDKLRDAEERWEKEQMERENEYKKRQETVWDEWEQEQRRRWKEWTVRREGEKEKIDGGMKDIADAMKEIEELSITLNKEREKIKGEWEMIEGEMEKIEKGKKEIEDMEAGVVKDRKLINHLVEGRDNTLVAFPKLTSRISEIYKEKERELRNIEKERNEIIKERSNIEDEWRRIQEEKERIEKDMKLMGKKEIGVSKDISKGWEDIEKIKMGFNKGDLPNRKGVETSRIIKGLSKIEKDLLKLKREHEKTDI